MTQPPEALYQRLDRFSRYEWVPALCVGAYVVATAIASALAYGFGREGAVSFLQWAVLTGLVVGLGLLQSTAESFVGARSSRWEDRHGPNRRLFFAVMSVLVWAVAMGLLLVVESMRIAVPTALVALFALMVAAPSTAAMTLLVIGGFVSLRAITSLVLRRGRALPLAVGARPIGTEYPACANALQGVMLASGMRDIDLYVVDGPVPNGYAVRYLGGLKPARRAVILTKPLAANFKPEELRGVIAFLVASFKAPRIHRESVTRDMEALLLLHEPQSLLRALRAAERFAVSRPSTVDSALGDALEKHTPWFESFVPWLLYESPAQPRIAPGDLAVRIRNLQEVSGVEGLDQPRTYAVAPSA